MSERERSTAAKELSSRAMVVFSREAASVGEARLWIEAFLEARGVLDGVREDVQLVVSELVTNGLMHGAGELVVRSAITADDVHVSVSDSGDGLPEVLPIDPTRVGGLGLIVVGRLSTEWGVAAFPGGKTVWATLALPS